MTMLRILHLVGSAYDEFYCDLSRLFAKDSLTATNSSLYDFRTAYITPDGHWRFPASLSQADIAAAQPYPLSDALKFLTEQNIDVMLPHMFCLPGMTHYRALFDLLNIPYVGNTPEVMALAAHKARAKAIVAAAGVKVPHGELLRSRDIPSIKPPAVVKPASSDNSIGVTLVKDPKSYDAALEAAFEYADEVIVEDFIELGREVRCGIIVRDGQLVGLPLEEYAVDKYTHPIRNYSDKLKSAENDGLSLVAKEQTKAWIVDPNDPITELVQAVAKQCHQALGCRHYSLFDFRIDPLGQPWFLEAGLYCSFSPKSVVATMARAAGISLDELLKMMIEQIH